MNRSFLLFLTLVSFFLFSQCSSDPQRKSFVEEEALEMNGEENEDGIRLAQEQEFEMTKDVSLGYIPVNRLIRATEELKAARRNNLIAARVNALSWTERGPNSDAIGATNGNTRGTQPASDAVTSGRMRAIWVDLTSSTTIWAGGVAGGLWKSTNIASTSSAVWSPVNDFLGNLSIASICQDPSNTNIMYFGTGEKTFNTDAVRGGGVWKSTDHGVTWNLLGNTTGFTNVSKVLCDAAGNIYVATIGTNGIQRSNDGGGTWTNITPTGLTTYVTEMKLSSTGRLHIVCGYQNTGTSGYRFTDAASTVAAGTWTSPTTTFPTAYNSELAVAGTTLYALPSNVSDLTPTIYKSTDGGDNWAATATSPPGTAVEPTINGGQGWYDLAIGVDPANANNVIAGGLNFYRSVDGGATWSQITRWVGTAFSYVHADHHTVTWNGSQVLVGTDGGIFYSNDNGTTFTDRNDGLRLKQFYSCAIHPSLTNYFLAGAQDNGVHQLNGAGLTSSVEVTGGDGAFVHIDQDQPQYQFGSYVRGQYRRSTDGGASWSSVTYSTTIGQFINPTDYDDIGNKMYTSAAAGQYVRWENPQTGSTFTPIAIAAFNASTVRSVTVSPYTANRVFFGTAGGRIVKVDNADQAAPTATNITQAGMSATIVSSIAVGTNDNNLLATFSNYGSIHIWVTTNGGTSWTNISGSGLPDIPVRWAMFYPEDNTKAILATEMGIYETDLINGVSTVWVQNAGFPTVKTNMLQYRKSDGTILAATHGRGLWTATIPLSPYIRFESALSLKTEATATASSCRNYTDYTVNMNIDAAPAGAATVTLSIAGGATATQGIDYDFTTNGNFAAPSNVLTFANGSVTPQPITVRVYNDAETESTESFTFNYVVSGVTTASAAPSSLSHTFTITDNDAAPIPAFSGNFLIGVNNTTVTTQSPFRSNLQKFRIQLLYTAAELQAAGILTASGLTSMTMRVTTKNSTQAYNGFTISLANTSAGNLSTGFISPAFTQVFTGNYSSVVGDNLFTFSTPFAWDGISNVLVNICFDNAPGAADVSADVTEATSAPLGAGVRASTYSSSVAGAGCSLAAAFVSDARVTATFAASGGTQIETALNSNRSEYAGNNGTYYFYNGSTILSNITAASANLGCVSSNIFEAGTTWSSFNSGQRSQKVFEIIPTTNSGASYTVGLYFTAAELAGKIPSGLKIAKTNAASIAAANGTNTTTAVTSFAAFGAGYLFTASFTGFSKFFLVDNNVVLPVELISFNGALNNQQYSQLHWRTVNQVNLSNFEVQRSYDGIHFTKVGTVNALQNSSALQDYDFADAVIAKAVNFYRLKMNDVDGKSSLSTVIQIKNNQLQKFAELSQNPVTDQISFRLNNRDKENVTVQLFSSTGQLVVKLNMGKVDGNVIVPFNISRLPGGVYTLGITAGNKTESLRVIKQ